LVVKSNPRLACFIQQSSQSSLYLATQSCTIYADLPLTEYTMIVEVEGRQRSCRFSCSCGYIFAARLGDVDANGQPVKLRVIEYGEAFADHARALVASGMPRIAVCRRLGFDRKALRRMLAYRLPMRSPSNEYGTTSSRPRRTAREPDTEKQSLRDWGVRDADLCIKIPHTVSQILAIDPSIRVTISEISRRLNLRSLDMILRK
jgi:hypothetical protein